ncbi:hypothetical protein ACFFX1_47915 [Dactylosporangium sucinum]|uniref:Uncharacterized protein n=1 Tax=Dactylosporangium sucinum TaxID=1424081 RepID=A0A917TNP0_9ACTN|nr:hypothetical protein [Dactylosporangium sucinum]GGM29412.1 hypothetical protein GCM10007977_033390 [Dactylosporangium sucinum]
MSDVRSARRKLGGFAAAAVVAAGAGAPPVTTLSLLFACAAIPVAVGLRGGRTQLRALLPPVRTARRGRTREVAGRPENALPGPLPGPTLADTGNDERNEGGRP